MNNHALHPFGVALFFKRAGFKTFILCFAMLPVLAPSATGQACSGNLLANPGFESSFASWNDLGFGEITTASPHGGSKALKICGAPTDDRVIQAVPVMPGQQYTLQFWGKWDGGNSFFGGRASLKFLTATWQPFAPSLVYIDQANWTQYTTTATAPANAAYLEIAFDNIGSANCAFFDDACLTTGGGGNLPDLALSGDVFIAGPPSPYQAGQNLFYQYYLANLGNGAANGNFTVKTWISTDQTLSPGDVQADVHPYSDVPPNFFFQVITDFLTVPNLPNGQYYLILQADADGQIIEGDETNNITVSSNTFTIGGGGTGQIELSLTLQQLTASPVIYSNYSVKATVSNAGPQAATDVKVKFAKPNGVVYVGGNQFTASQGSFNPNGNEEWTVGSIPSGGSATLTVNYFLLQSQAPVAYAQVIAANETDSDSQPNNGTPPTLNQDDEASTVSTPPNLQPDLTIADLQIPNASVQAGQILNYDFDLSNIGTAAVPGNFTVKSYISTDNVLSANDIQDGVVPTGNFGAGVMVNNVAGASTIPASLLAGSYFLIVKVDADGQVAESNEGNNVVFKNFTVTGGGNLPDLDFIGAAFIAGPPSPYQAGQNLFYQYTFGNLGNGAASGTFTVKTWISSDITLSPGDVLADVHPFSDVPANFIFQVTTDFLTIPNLPNGQYYVIVQADADGQIVEGDETNNITVSSNTFTIGGSNPDCNAITITPAPGSITIAGASAPHVLIKVFRPNWTVAFECLDGACSNPQVVSGLSAGSHFVEIKLLNASWGEICKKTQTVNVSAFGGGNGTQQLKIVNDRQRLAFDNIYPNPSKYWVALEIYSKQDQEVALDFYDGTGRPVHRQETQLDEGRNVVEINVSEWKSGAYNVIGRGEGLPAYGRFLKVWED